MLVCIYSPLHSVLIHEKSYTFATGVNVCVGVFEFPRYKAYDERNKNVYRSIDIIRGQNTGRVKSCSIFNFCNSMS
jgi:hypothetical protein